MMSCRSTKERQVVDFAHRMMNHAPWDIMGRIGCGSACILGHCFHPGGPLPSEVTGGN